MAEIPEEIIAHILGMLSDDEIRDHNKEEVKPWYLNDSQSEEDEFLFKRQEYWSDDRLDAQASYERTMVKLCLVSKSFLRCAQPLLFKTQIVVRRPHPKCQLFLRTLLENSKLSIFVEEVHFHVVEECKGKGNEVLEDLVKAYDDKFPRPMSKYAAALKKGSHGAEIALLLFLCKNIRTLTIISPKGSFYDNPLAKLLRHIYPSPQSPRSSNSQTLLSKLQNLNLMNSPYYCAFSHIGVIETLMRIPSLKYFRGADIGLMGTFPSSIRDYSRLTSFHLWDASWDSMAVGEILSVASNLQNLELHAGWKDVRRVDYNFSALGDVLRVHGKNLQRLIIELEDDCDRRYHFQRGHGQNLQAWSLGSLKPLQQLQYLVAPMFLLVDCTDNEQRVSTLSTGVEEAFAVQRNDQSENLRPKNGTNEVWHWGHDWGKAVQRDSGRWIYLCAFYGTLVDSVLPDAFVGIVSFLRHGCFVVGDIKVEYWEGIQKGEESCEVEYR